MNWFFLFAKYQILSLTLFFTVLWIVSKCYNFRHRTRFITPLLIRTLWNVTLLKFMPEKFHFSPSIIFAADFLFGHVSNIHLGIIWLTLENKFTEISIRSFRVHDTLSKLEFFRNDFQWSSQRLGQVSLACNFIPKLVMLTLRVHYVFKQQ